LAQEKSKRLAGNHYFGKNLKFGYDYSTLLLLGKE
jgi:hypothetical protein